MKASLQILLLFIFLSFGFFSCQEKSLTLQDQSNSSVIPDYNFIVETVGSDIITPGTSVTYNLYIRQQNTYAAGQKYYLTFTLADTYDASAIVSGNAWKSGDIIPVAYDSLVRNNYRVKMIYTPVARSAQNYSISFTCKDEKGAVHNFSKNITIQ